MWEKELHKKLIDTYGAAKTAALVQKYESAFPANYQDEYTPTIALSDINNVEKLSPENLLEIDYFTQSGGETPLSIRFFQWNKPSALSDVLPMLENMGLKVENFNSSKLLLNKNQPIWINEFNVNYSQQNSDISNSRDAFSTLLKNIHYNRAENDGFNKLVLGAGLDSREIMVLRTYAKYLKQIGFRFSQTYIEKALLANPSITKNLAKLFLDLHDPNSRSLASNLEKEINTALDSVTSLDEDRIIRNLFALIKATLRTNYFQTTSTNQPKEYLAIKLKSAAIPDLPQPAPMYEMFIYSPRFEAIHLRSSKVARGGLRWSDRLEDFRTEVLGLMKAQIVKNAVIVPSGAKGGFVLKSISPNASREELRAEVVYCYQSFIRGLLDITDNIIDEKIIPPVDVVCLDDPDPYLVVAADKGTATFSDTANAISQEYNFWLADAFASGGSAGYDHKKMGITAKGAWESIKRHFRELDTSLETTNITVVGIGDMSGDVFGNGLMYSKHLKLLAAFDHRHIFIDPNPNPESSYHERVRLFNLPTSSWEDYNPQLISQGGGVFKRSLKSIAITKEMQAALGMTESVLTPMELITAILKAPVDLLFNGGIGTYIKASTENNLDVGDRTNDYCRINGEDLRCKVVGEGGNLGITQRGRIEYALKGGLINTDFIDNSGGVDCSDHEVNLKILLNEQVQKNKLTTAERDRLLVSLTDEISKLVLSDNYQQALLISFSAFHARKYFGLHATYLKELEVQGIIKRKIEFLPDDKVLVERKAAEQGLTRPEIAVLASYTKINIKKEVLNSPIIQDSYLSKIILTAFPPTINKLFAEAINSHKLRQDIIATQLSNQVVNEMGITFVYRLQRETGAKIDEIIRAHTVASHIFETKKFQKIIENLDFKISVNEQYEMLYNIRQLINLSTRWFLLNKHLRTNLEQLVQHYSENISKIQKMIPDLMSGVTKTYLASLVKRFTEMGINREIAETIATYRAIYTVLNIIDLATIHQHDVKQVARIYFYCGERLNLVWFRDQIASDTRDGHWSALARLTLRDELDIAQRALSVAIMKKSARKPDADIAQLIDQWIANNTRGWQRWEHMLDMLHESTVIDYTMLFIAIRELTAFITASE